MKKNDVDWKGIAHCWEMLVKENQKQAEILRILKKYPKWKGSLEGLSHIGRYWKEQKKEITKELLEIYDIPFNVNEFATIIEWLEEKEQNGQRDNPIR